VLLVLDTKLEGILLQAIRKSEWYDQRFSEVRTFADATRFRCYREVASAPRENDQLGNSWFETLGEAFSLSSQNGGCLEGLEKMVLRDHQRT